jgi:hypothetical protein
VTEEGTISDRVTTSTTAYACMLGGPDGRTLHVVTGALAGPDAAGQGQGRIETCEVTHPHAGYP